MDRITPEQRDELRRLVRIAAPAPWGTDPVLMDQLVVSSEGKLVADCCVMDAKGHVDTIACSVHGRLIATARNLLPALLQEIDLLEAELQKIDEVRGLRHRLFLDASAGRESWGLMNLLKELDKALTPENRNG